MFGGEERYPTGVEPLALIPTASRQNRLRTPAQRIPLSLRRCATQRLARSLDDAGSDRQAGGRVRRSRRGGKSTGVPTRAAREDRASVLVPVNRRVVQDDLVCAFDPEHGVTAREFCSHLALSE